MKWKYIIIVLMLVVAFIVFTEYTGIELFSRSGTAVDRYNIEERLAGPETDLTRIGRLCEYDSISAACGQLLLIYPEGETVRGVTTVLDKYNARVIGAAPEENLIQISVIHGSVLTVKEALEKTDLVEVRFNVPNELR